MGTGSNAAENGGSATERSGLATAQVHVRVAVVNGELTIFVSPLTLRVSRHAETQITWTFKHTETDEQCWMKLEGVAADYDKETNEWTYRWNPAFHLEPVQYQIALLREHATNHFAVIDPVIENDPPSGALSRPA